MNVTCFIAGAEKADLQKTINELNSSGLTDKVFVVSSEKPDIEDVEWIEGDGFQSTEAIRHVAEKATGDFALFYTKSLPLRMSQYGLERMVRMASDAETGLFYADHYELKNSELQKHPVIDYQEGSLRDDFDFGSVLLFKTEALKNAAKAMDHDYLYAGLYDLRLRVSRHHRIARLPEYLYTEVETDTRKSGQKQFDYVDPKNRAVQIEMEQACTAHLKRTGAWLEPKFKNVTFDMEIFPVEASVIIPVKNRVKTIGDAIGSVLRQQTDFEFNVIVVDNYSTDGTTELISDFAKKDKRVIHVIPDRKDLGIGGCWNVGVHHELCGKFSIQLDSDDMYIDEHVLTKIVNAFYAQHSAMVIGAYQIVNFDLEEIPPGLIDHKEWTPDNGRNNALRINGLGAPRAFFTPLLRDIKVPNSNYGEDYALVLMFSRYYRIGRIYESLYLCRRWEDNSDAELDIPRLNENNLYKDRIRTIELWARQQYVAAGQPV